MGVEISRSRAGGKPYRERSQMSEILFQFESHESIHCAKTEPNSVCRTVDPAILRSLHLRFLMNFRSASPAVSLVFSPSQHRATHLGLRRRWRRGACVGRRRDTRGKPADLT
ncbi:uncharacterized protein LOC124661849 [Lolium rigidum]|uniref:uncharacterized protein LOC124661849 n=1 Tax=Lolium rigidum TaxID=89674 RepID=UPI001F5C0BFF|nr:uncharacterized protein LOC124661849 [Lolium rigidum]